MLKLIVNGDDFGLTEGMNNGILRSFLSGILTSTSIMANGNAFKNAVQIARNNQNLDVGIHLTLVGGTPVLDDSKIPSLLKKQGRFYDDYKDFVKAYITGKFSLDEIKKEFKAQIEKVLDSGIKLSHIDSHQHIHCFPKVMDITIELSEKFNIPYIRFPKEHIAPYMLADVEKISRFFELLVINSICSLIKNRIPKSSEYFAGFFTGGRLNKSNLMKVIKNLPKEGTCELMCHPGLFDGKENPYSYWKYDFEGEVAALTDDDVKELILQKGIILTSFCRES
jgi:chitin disaccharide deacetylase